MNKTARLLALLAFSAYLTSCSSSSTQTSRENVRPSSPDESAISSTLPVNDIIEPVINIPSTNETAPAGILEQINWAPSGGGDTTVTLTCFSFCVQ